jgi:hypothetical protein
MMTSWLAFTFSPSELFSVGEQGVWFDPSDVANLNWRRNLLTWTEQFDNADWIKTATTVTANAVAAPDGTNTADAVFETTANSQHIVYQVRNEIAVSTVYTFSAYVRGDGRDWCILSVYDGSAELGRYFNLTGSGSVGGRHGVGGTVTGAIQSVGGGWYRCTITTTTTAAAAGRNVAIFSATADGTNSYIGDITRGLYVWGAQLELGSTATDYQRITDVNTEVIERFPNATLYQDTAGTTPVTTTGQSVGLMLDKSRGLVLGPELISNGDFSGGSTGWTFDAGWVISGGVASSNGTNTVASNLAQSTLATVVGRTYRITFTYSVTAGRIRLSTTHFGNTPDLSAGSSGTFTGSYVATAATGNFTVQARDAGTIATIDNISVKELAGNHAVQATTANRPIYGVHPFGGRRNLLTWTEDLTSVAWTKTEIVSPAAGTETKIIPTTANSEHRVFAQPSTTASSVRAAIDAKAGEYSFVWVGSYNGSVYNYAIVDLTTGTIAAQSALGGATVTPVTGGWHRISVTGAPTVGFVYLAVCPVPSAAVGLNAINVPFFAGTGTSGAFVRYPQLEAGTTATAYQRVTDQYNVTEAGVSSVSYLFFDGVNDSLATPSINFATATSDGQARRNLLTFPTAFDDAVWNVLGGTLVVTPNTVAAPDGTMTADSIALANAFKLQAVTVSSGQLYSFSVYLRTDTGTKNIQLYEANGSGSVTVTVTTAWQRFTLSYTSVNVTNYVGIDQRSGTSPSQSGTLYAWGAQLETGTTASAFQNIGTDKMTVFAGVRTLGSLQAVLTELSSDTPSFNGAWNVQAPLTGLGAYRFVTKGTAAVAIDTAAITPPNTQVLTATSNISGDSAVTRLNGVQAAQSTSDQGAGNFGNYPLFIGARNSASLFFSGNLYSLIVRGAQSNTGQISSTETWVASRTGIVI